MGESYHRAAKLAKRKLPHDSGRTRKSHPEIALTPSGPWARFLSNTYMTKTLRVLAGAERLRKS
jgi:hypothetical protein